MSGNYNSRPENYIKDDTHLQAFGDSAVGALVMDGDIPIDDYKSQPDYDNFSKSLMSTMLSYRRFLGGKE
jgi:hypothetical protein